MFLLMLQYCIKDKQFTGVARVIQDVGPLKSFLVGVHPLDSPLWGWSTVVFEHLSQFETALKNSLGCDKGTDGRE